MRKYSFNAHRVHHSVQLMVILSVLTVFLFPNVAGGVYISLLMEPCTTVTSPPVILEEGNCSGTSTIYTNSTSAKVSTVAPAPIPSYYPTQYSVLSGDWWDSNYSYRKKISITNNNMTVPIPAKFTINFTIDTQQMVTDGKLQADGDDFRIVWWNSSSSSWLELDRLNTTSFNTASTTIKSRTQTSLAEGSSDDNYYIYYGHSGATNPPANGSNVYFLEDLFNRAANSTVGFGWTEQETGNADARIASNTLVSTNVLDLYGANTGMDCIAQQSISGLDDTDRYVWEFGFAWDRDSAEDHYEVYMQLGNSSITQSSPWTGVGVFLSWTGTGTDTTIANGASAHEMLRVFDDDQTPTEVEVVSGGADFKLAVHRSNGNFELYRDGTLKDTYNFYQTLSTYDTIRFVSDSIESSNIVKRGIDYTRVYLAMDPNPSVSLDQKESYYHVLGTVPGSVETKDSDYLIIKSAGSATTTLSYNPSDYILGGSTILQSGSVSNLTLNDDVRMIFGSYHSDNTTSQPIANMNFTSDATGWVYGEANDVNNYASGAWSSTGGNGGTGCYDLMVDDTDGNIAFDVEQWVNYTFTIDSVPLKAIMYASYRYTSDDDATGTPKIKLVRPDGSVVDVWAGSTVTLETGSDTGHTYVSVDATSNFTSTGTYQLSLYTHTDSLKAADKATVHNYWDDAGLTLTESIYAAEVEFTGSSNTYTWTELNLTVDSSWTNDSVDVTIQVYDSTAGQYPTTGEGYLAYTSGTANTDETKTLTIKTHHFRNATGNWKIKVKGTKTIDTPFDFRADWIEYKPTHYSEYTVSTEFILSGMTENTPTQLNFTAVTQANTTGVNVTIQVWNYSSSAYVTSGEGYSTYMSSGSNETTDLSINTNPELYTSGGNSKIKITGTLTTSSTYQQETNQIKLVYKYDTASSYDYVLAVTEKNTLDWKVNLTVYDSLNIARLSGTTISFYDGTSSDQIVVNGGSITQSEGPAYNLNSSSTIKIKMSNLDATSSGTSYLHVHLKTLVPDTSTYALYTITFEIT
jgi:hypothetical protein